MLRRYEQLILQACLPGIVSIFTGGIGGETITISLFIDGSATQTGAAHRPLNRRYV